MYIVTDQLSIKASINFSCYPGAYHRGGRLIGHLIGPSAAIPPGVCASAPLPARWRRCPSPRPQADHTMPARSKVAFLFTLLSHASAIAPAIPVGDDAKNAAMTRGDLSGLHLVITCVHDSAAMNMMDKDGNMLPWQEWVRKPPPSSPSLTTISFNCRRYAHTAPP